MFKNVLPSTLSLLLATIVWTNPVVAAEDKNSPTANLQFGDQIQTESELSNVHHSGKMFLKKVKVKNSTIINGSLEVLDSLLNKETIVNGRVNARESQFKELTVNGDTQLKGVAILGPVNINGKLEVEHVRVDGTLEVDGSFKAKDSAFKKMITVNNTNTELDHCTLDDITFHKDDKDQNQYLHLKATKVSGNIDFKSGKGIIRLDSQSSISGKVTGAKIEK